MLYISKDDLYPEHEVLHYMTEKNVIHIDKVKIHKNHTTLVNRLKSLTLSLDLQLRSYLSSAHSGNIKDDMITYLLLVGVPDKMIPLTKRGNRSLSADVCKNIILNNYEKNLVEIYMYYSSLKSRAGTLTNFVAGLSSCEIVLGDEGEELYVQPYNIRQTENRRFTTFEPNIIGYVGLIGGSMKAPKGKVVVYADFPQIDGKVTLNTLLDTPEIKAFQKNTNDSYLVFFKGAQSHKYRTAKKKLKAIKETSHFVDLSSEEKFVKDFDADNLSFSSKQERDEYKVSSLATTYGSQNTGSKEVVNDLTAMLEGNDTYRSYVDTVKMYIDLNLPVITKSVWGYTRIITDTKTQRDDIINTAINSPIQTTSSEIIYMFNTKILNYFRQLGYDKEQVYLALNRHDEPIFIMDEDIFMEHAEFLALSQNIVVDGWYPFRMELRVGKAYKQPDEYYTNLLTAFAEKEDIIAFAEERLDTKYPSALQMYPFLYINYITKSSGDLILMIVYRDSFGKYNVYTTELNLYDEETKTSQPMSLELLLSIAETYLIRVNAPITETIIFNKHFSSRSEFISVNGRPVQVSNNQTEYWVETVIGCFYDFVMKRFSAYADLIEDNDVQRDYLIKRFKSHKELFKKGD